MSNHATYYPFDLTLRVENSDLILKHAATGLEHKTRYRKFITQYGKQLSKEKIKLSAQKKAGGQLFEALFPDVPGSLGAAFRKVLAEHDRVRLRLFYPPEHLGDLLEIPWEYLYAEPERPDCLSGFLCQRSSFSLVHCLREPVPENSRAEVSLPLKVVFLSALDNPVQDFENIVERNPIVQLEKHPDGMRTVDFRGALKNYEMAQFLMHGTLDAVYLKDNDAGDAKLTGAEIIGMLEDLHAYQIQTVVMCACQAADNPSGPVIQLHKAGVPIVIGFTRTIRETKAVRFMEDFYAEMVNGAGKVEEAVAFARTGLIQSQEGVYSSISEETELSLDWTICRVFLAGVSGDLIPEDRLFKPVYPDFRGRFQREVENRLKKALQNGSLEKQSELETLETWFTGAPRTLYLHGASGTGKSTLIARFISAHAKNKELLYHLCNLQGGQKDQENANHPLVFVRDSLYPQLEELFGKKQYRAWVGNYYPYLIDDPKEALQRLVLDPLRKARKSGKWKQPVLILDGLDRAQTFEPGYTILDLLSDFIPFLTEVMRLLLSASSDVYQNDADQRIREFLGEPDHELPLEVDKNALKRDFNRFYKKAEEKFKLRPEIQLRAAFGAFRKDPGRIGQINYQFLSFIQRIEAPELLEAIFRAPFQGNCLETAYQTALEFTLRQNPAQADPLDRLLQILGWAYVPLPAALLADLVETDPIDPLLKLISFFVQRDEQGCISCEHPSIKYFLTTLKSSHSPHELFVRMYLRKAADPANWNSLEWSRLADDYGARYLAEHAYRFYILERKKDLQGGLAGYLNLMTAPGFRKFRRTHNDEPALLNDLQRIVRVYALKIALQDFPRQVKELAGQMIHQIALGEDSGLLDNLWQTANPFLTALADGSLLDTRGRYNDLRLLELDKILATQPVPLSPEALYDTLAAFLPSTISRLKRELAERTGHQG